MKRMFMFLFVLALIVSLVSCSDRTPLDPIIDPPITDIVELEIRANTFSVSGTDTLFGQYNVRDNIPNNVVLFQIFGENDEGVFEVEYLDELGKPVSILSPVGVDSKGRNYYLIYWGRYIKPFRFYGKLNEN